MFVYLAMAYKDSDYTIMIAEGVSLSTTNSKPEVYLKTFFPVTEKAGMQEWNVK